MKQIFILVLALFIGGNLMAQKMETKTKHKHSEQKMKKKTKGEVASTFACPMKCEGEKTYAKAGSCPVCKMDLKNVNYKNKGEVAANTYNCPMKCEGEKVYTEAGNCPKCNMALAKKK